MIWKWQFITDCISSVETSPSIKRLVILICMWTMIISVFASIFLKLLMPDYMWYGLLGIVIGGLGLTVAEKVWGDKTPEDKTQN